MCTSFVIFSFNDKSLTLREELGLKMDWLGLAWKSWKGVGGGGRSASPPDARYHKQIIHISCGQVAYAMYKYTSWMYSHYMIGNIIYTIYTWFTYDI